MLASRKRGQAVHSLFTNDAYGPDERVWQQYCKKVHSTRTNPRWGESCTVFCSWIQFFLTFPFHSEYYWACAYRSYRDSMKLLKHVCILFSAYRIFRFESMTLSFHFQNPFRFYESNKKCMSHVRTKNHCKLSRSLPNKSNIVELYLNSHQSINIVLSDVSSFGQ